jgi:hypothetical protein
MWAGEIDSLCCAWSGRKEIHLKQGKTPEARLEREKISESFKG